MTAKIPKLSETCELHWKNLVDCIQETTNSQGPLYVVLKAEPIVDTIDGTFILDDKNNVVECPNYPIDVFRLYIKSGDSDEVGNNYLGSAKRVFEQDTEKFSYAPKSIEQLRHQVGLRLERLNHLGRDVYFASELLGCKEQQVTHRLLKDLFASESTELSIVMEKILGSD